MYGRRPLTRLETALFVIIAGILATVLIDRLQRMAELAEKAAMEVTVLRVQSALQLRIALASLKGAPLDTQRWPRGNPFELAQAIPPNYLGELSAPDLRALSAGNWFFDRDRGELAYLVNRSRYFSGGSDPVPVVRYRLDAGAPQGAAFPQASLRLVTPYRWEPQSR